MSVFISTTDLLKRIEELQQIQKTHNSKTTAWQTASELLAPCFAEMARRQAVARQIALEDEPHGVGPDGWPYGERA